MFIQLYFIISLIIFFISILGLFISRQNIITIFIAIELMLLALNFNFVLFSLFFDDALNQVIFFYLLALAGAEASIGLAILIIFYRIRGLISVYFMNVLKG